ncbi:MAG: prephenate dehydrogenase [Candidatus Desulfovibrio kirbyi]|uniref:Prephenate dehydrogenase n=1 Tax=Candidatus Desulfovibrio kirbyi TaxID=2696086 RepID=A0A6L2R612_9BACT|nr:MAG: prephenate dehydrogenase [Candidatus Desulfovibrio kirbyi]
MNKKTVIIGARGRMGVMFLERAQKSDIDVAGVDTPLAPQILAQACAHAGMVLFCVPAAVLESALDAVCPHLPAHVVLADITSVKEYPLQHMQSRWQGPVVGTHPLFGPAPEPDADLPVAIVPGRSADAASLTLVETFFTRIGCRVFRTTAKKHDVAMSRIQGMNFITTLAYFALLAGDDELLPFLTPSFHRRGMAAKKMLTEDARLFAGLFEANPHSYEAVRLYRQMLNLAAAGDIDLLCEKVQWWWGTNLVREGGVEPPCRIGAGS